MDNQIIQSSDRGCESSQTAPITPANDDYITDLVTVVSKWLTTTRQRVLDS
jgi:hypothetical protein